MKYTILSFHDVEPLTVTKMAVGYTSRDNPRVANNNLRIGAAIFNWLYSKVPKGIWDGFVREATKHNIEIKLDRG